MNILISNFNTETESRSSMKWPHLRLFQRRKPDKGEKLDVYQARAIQIFQAISKCSGTLEWKHRQETEALASGFLFNSIPCSSSYKTNPNPVMKCRGTKPRAGPLSVRPSDELH